MLQSLRSEMNRVPEGDPTVSSVTIQETEFVEMAHLFKIDNVKAFYTSELFRENRFSYDPSKKCIVQAI